MRESSCMIVRAASLVFVSLMLVVLVAPLVCAQNGPIMEVLRHEVIQSPDAKLIAMQTGQVDVIQSSSSTMDLCSVPEAQVDSLLRNADIEKLDSEGYLITQDLGFHTGFIGFNIRNTATIQSYYRPEVSYWPLADVEFRHALIHCYDQLTLIDQYYQYYPTGSLVAPSQQKYFNPYVPEHPYNPGNPFTSVAGEHSSCGILLAAGYTFQDVGTVGVVDNNDYWKCPGGIDMPEMHIFTPLIDVAPTSFQHGAEFVTDLRAIGVAGTTENGGRGLVHQGYDFNEYLNLCYGTPTASGGFFDAFMGFFSFERLPEQLYTFCHSSQDTQLHPLRGNAVGINDVTIDSLAETVEYSVDTNEIGFAAKQIQERLYDPQLPGADSFALAYMCLYSKMHISAYSTELGGIVTSFGYGSDNKWTFLNIHWAGTPRLEDVDGDGDQETIVVSALDDAPDSFNPLRATTSCEWEILEQVYDGLVGINPYNHADIPWLATGWAITETVAGMDIDVTLRDDVLWQDGFDFTAYDVEWCLEFLRDMEVPRYYTALQDLIDVVVTDDTHLTIQLSAAGLSLFYDVMGVGALLAPQIWDRAWANNQEVLDWIPTGAYSPAPGYAAGPTPTPTNVMGTGPFIFQFYDTTNLYDDMYANRNYFMTQAAVATLKTSMFWEVGDEDRGGIINIYDLTYVSIAFGSYTGEPLYNPDADFDQNGFVDMRDLVTCNRHLMLQKEYP